MPSTHRLQILNPLETPNWDALVLSHPEGTIFHSAPWARVLQESYGYDPTYFVSFDNGAIETLLPFMDVRSILTGRRGVSLPFTDYCRAILPSGADFHEAFAQVVEHGFRQGWKSIELRSDASLPAEIPASATFHRHTLDLSQGETALHANLRDSTRRNIRKALKAGVTVTLETSTEALHEFYRLNCLTRKHHGLPPQPSRFFSKLHEHIFSKGLGTIVLASYKAEVIAAAVFLGFGRKALYKYGASDRRHQQLRANNLVMWEAIRWYAASGHQKLCFGRTEPEHTGLLQFKQGWTDAEERIDYCRFDLKQRTFIEVRPKGSSFSYDLFRAMPLPLLRVTGTMLYRHVA